VKKLDSEFGNYVFEMKLLHKDTDWKIGYSFDTNRRVEDLSELNEVKQIITESEHSPFNKAPLLSRFSDKGTITLTGSSMTVWADGEMKKEEIDQNRFVDLAKEHFGMSLKTPK
jgi:N-hydroxyarylamine O-acetyltransferase